MHLAVGGWHGKEAVGVAGVDEDDVASSTNTISRQLYRLPGLMPDAERAKLLSEIKQRGASFDMELDTVDSQATFMCRVIAGGEPMDASLAAQVAPLCARLCAYVRARFDSESACVSEVLIRRYLPEERRRLEAHFDVSAFATAIVSLSDASEYSGGLYVQSVPGVPSRRYVSLDAGDGLVHRFDTMHGVQLHRGARYSLVVWFSESAVSLKDGSAPWVQRAAEGGNAEAMFILGGFHYRGDEFGYGAANLPLAVEWLAKAARRNHALAQVHLASMIGGGEVAGALLEGALRVALPGEAAAEALPAAAELYARAAAQEHPSGQYALGRAYLHGEGVAKDEERARSWLERAAAQGSDENVAAAWARDELEAMNGT